MRVLLAIAAAIALLAIALAVTAPASLVDQRLQALSGGRLRLAGASGTLWSGTGELVLLPRGTRRSVAWQLEAWPLARGELRGSVAIDAADAPRAEFVYGPHNVALRRLDLALPMESVLEASGVPGALVGAGGSLALHVERFVQRAEAIDADAVLQWRDASLPSPRPGVRIALGDVRLDLRGAGSEAAGALSNRGGDVEVGGRVALSSLLIPRIDLTVRPRAGLDRDRAAAIAAALSLVAAPDGQGAYRIVWSGS
ncbi:MAG TPA: type II secretion system protein N [Casimicrobiaceae bacterium]|nr:type II secretion system protein N [Casimicrobiaceae bacterium]